MIKTEFLPGKNQASWYHCLEPLYTTEPRLWLQSDFCDYAPSVTEPPLFFYCWLPSTEVFNLKQLTLNMFLKILPSNSCLEHLC